MEINDTGQSQITDTNEETQVLPSLAEHMYGPDDPPVGSTQGQNTQQPTVKSSPEQKTQDLDYIDGILTQTIDPKNVLNQISKTDRFIVNPEEYYTEKYPQMDKAKFKEFYGELKDQAVQLNTINDLLPADDFVQKNIDFAAGRPYERDKNVVFSQDISTKYGFDAKPLITPQEEAYSKGYALKRNPVTGIDEKIPFSVQDPSKIENAYYWYDPSSDQTTIRYANTALEAANQQQVSWWGPQTLYRENGDWLKSFVGANLQLLTGLGMFVEDVYNIAASGVQYHWDYLNEALDDSDKMWGVITGEPFINRSIDDIDRLTGGYMDKANQAFGGNAGDTRSYEEQLQMKKEYWARELVQSNKPEERVAGEKMFEEIQQSGWIPNRTFSQYFRTSQQQMSQQTIDEGQFGSLGSFVNNTNSLMGQITSQIGFALIMQLVTGGATSIAKLLGGALSKAGYTSLGESVLLGAVKSGRGFSSFSNNFAFAGTTTAMSYNYKDALDHGFSSAEASQWAWGNAPATFMTEKWLSGKYFGKIFGIEENAIVTKGFQDVVQPKIREFIGAQGKNVLTDTGKRSFNNFMSTKVNPAVQKYLMSTKYVVQPIIGGTREGIQEASEQLWVNVMKELDSGLRDPQFIDVLVNGRQQKIRTGNFDDQIFFSSEHANELWQNFIGGAIMGFLGGVGGAGKTFIQNKIQGKDATLNGIHGIILKGGTEDLIGKIIDEWKKGSYGTWQGVDGDMLQEGGEVLQVDQSIAQKYFGNDFQIKTMNDLAAYGMVDLILTEKSFVDQSLTKDDMKNIKDSSTLLESSFGLHNYLSGLTSTYKDLVDMRRTNKELDKDEANKDVVKANESKIAALEQELFTYTRNVPGSRFTQKGRENFVHAYINKHVTPNTSIEQTNKIIADLEHISQVKEQAIVQYNEKVQKVEDYKTDVSTRISELNKMVDALRGIKSNEGRIKHASIPTILTSLKELSELVSGDTNKDLVPYLNHTAKEQLSNISDNISGAIEDMIKDEGLTPDSFGNTELGTQFQSVLSTKYGDTTDFSDKLEEGKNIFKTTSQKEVKYFDSKEQDSAVENAIEKYILGNLEGDAKSINSLDVLSRELHEPIVERMEGDLKRALILKEAYIQLAKLRLNKEYFDVTSIDHPEVNKDRVDPEDDRKIIRTNAIPQNTLLSLQVKIANYNHDITAARVKFGDVDIQKLRRDLVKRAMSLVNHHQFFGFFFNFICTHEEKGKKKPFADKDTLPIGDFRKSINDKVEELLKIKKNLDVNVTQTRDDIALVNSIEADMVAIETMMYNLFQTNPKRAYEVRNQFIKKIRTDLVKDKKTNTITLFTHRIPVQINMFGDIDSEMYFTESDTSGLTITKLLSADFNDVIGGMKPFISSGNKAPDTIDVDKEITNDGVSQNNTEQLTTDQKKQWIYFYFRNAVNYINNITLSDSSEFYNTIMTVFNDREDISKGKYEYRPNYSQEEALRTLYSSTVKKENQSFYVFDKGMTTNDTHSIVSTFGMNGTGKTYMIINTYLEILKKLPKNVIGSRIMISHPNIDIANDLKKILTASGFTTIDVVTYKELADRFNNKQPIIDYNNYDIVIVDETSLYNGDMARQSFVPEVNASLKKSKKGKKIILFGDIYQSRNLEGDNQIKPTIIRNPTIINTYLDEVQRTNIEDIYRLNEAVIQSFNKTDVESIVYEKSRYFATMNGTVEGELTTGLKYFLTIKQIKERWLSDMIKSPVGRYIIFATQKEADDFLTTIKKDGFNTAYSQNVLWLKETRGYKPANADLRKNTVQGSGIEMAYIAMTPGISSFERWDYNTAVGRAKRLVVTIADDETKSERVENENMIIDFSKAKIDPKSKSYQYYKNRLELLGALYKPKETSQNEGQTLLQEAESLESELKDHADEIALIKDVRMSDKWFEAMRALRDKYKTVEDVQEENEGNDPLEEDIPEEPDTILIDDDNNIVDVDSTGNKSDKNDKDVPDTTFYRKLNDPFINSAKVFQETGGAIPITLFVNSEMIPGLEGKTPEEFFEIYKNHEEYKKRQSLLTPSANIVFQTGKYEVYYLEDGKYTLKTISTVVAMVGNVIVGQLPLPSLNFEEKVAYENILKTKPEQISFDQEPDPNKRQLLETYHREQLRIYQDIISGAQYRGSVKKTPSIGILKFKNKVDRKVREPFEQLFNRLVKHGKFRTKGSDTIVLKEISIKFVDGKSIVEYKLDNTTEYVAIELKNIMMDNSSPEGKSLLEQAETEFMGMTDADILNNEKLNKSLLYQILAQNMNQRSSWKNEANKPILEKRKHFLTVPGIANMTGAYKRNAYMAAFKQLKEGSFFTPISQHHLTDQTYLQNIYTNVEDVHIPYPHILMTRNDEKTGNKNTGRREKSVDFRSDTPPEVAQEYNDFVENMRFILGDSIMDRLHIVRPFYENGKWLYGYVQNGQIYIATKGKAGNQSYYKTEWHEASHFITQYILTDEEQKQLYSSVKEHMIQNHKDFNENVKGIDYRSKSTITNEQADEYLALSAQGNQVRGINSKLEDNVFQKAINWIKKYIFRKNLTLNMPEFLINMYSQQYANAKVLTEVGIRQDFAVSDDNIEQADDVISLEETTEEDLELQERFGSEENFYYAKKYIASRFFDLGPANLWVSDNIDDISNKTSKEVFEDLYRRIIKSSKSFNAFTSTQKKQVISTLTNKEIFDKVFKNVFGKFIISDDVATNSVRKIIENGDDFHVESSMPKLLKFYIETIPLLKFRLINGAITEVNDNEIYSIPNRDMKLDRTVSYTIINEKLKDIANIMPDLKLQYPNINEEELFLNAIYDFAVKEIPTRELDGTDESDNEVANSLLSLLLRFRPMTIKSMRMVDGKVVYEDFTNILSENNDLGNHSDYVYHSEYIKSLKAQVSPSDYAKIKSGKLTGLSKNYDDNVVRTIFSISRKSEASLDLLSALFTHYNSIAESTGLLVEYDRNKGSKGFSRQVRGISPIETIKNRWQNALSDLNRDGYIPSNIAKRINGKWGIEVMAVDGYANIFYKKDGKDYRILKYNYDTKKYEFEFLNNMYPSKEELVIIAKMFSNLRFNPWITKELIKEILKTTNKSISYNTNEFVNDFGRDHLAAMLGNMYSVIKTYSNVKSGSNDLTKETELLNKRVNEYFGNDTDTGTGGRGISYENLRTIEGLQRQAEDRTLTQSERDNIDLQINSLKQIKIDSFYREFMGLAKRLNHYADIRGKGFYQGARGNKFQESNLATAEDRDLGGDTNSTLPASDRLVGKVLRAINGKINPFFDGKFYRNLFLSKDIVIHRKERFVGLTSKHNGKNLNDFTRLDYFNSMLYGLFFDGIRETKNTKSYLTQGSFGTRKTVSVGVTSFKKINGKLGTLFSEFKFTKNNVTGITLDNATINSLVDKDIKNTIYWNSFRLAKVLIAFANTNLPLLDNKALKTLIKNFVSDNSSQKQLTRQDLSTTIMTKIIADPEFTTKIEKLLDAMNEIIRKRLETENISTADAKSVLSLLGLQDYQDYVFSKENGKEFFSIGHDASFNHTFENSTHNLKNIRLWLNAMKNTDYNDENLQYVRREIYHSSYNYFVKEMQSEGFKMKNGLEDIFTHNGNGVYMKPVTEQGGKTSKTTIIGIDKMNLFEWHPFFEGYFFSKNLYNNALDPITIGKDTQYENLHKMSSRIDRYTATGWWANTNTNGYVLPAKTKMVKIIDRNLNVNYLRLMRSVKKVGNMDGLEMMHQVLVPFMIQSFGGNSSIINQNNNIFKTREIAMNYQEGIASDAKSSLLALSSDEYYDTDHGRELNRFMLTDNGKYPEWGDRFDEYMAYTGNDYNAACKMLSDHIAFIRTTNPQIIGTENDPLMQIVGRLQMSTAAKVDSRYINDWDFTDISSYDPSHSNYKLDKLSMTEYNNDQSIVILNPNIDEEDITPSTQVEAGTSMDAGGPMTARSIQQTRVKILNTYIKENQSKINRLAEKYHISKKAAFTKWIRKVIIKSTESMPDFAQLTRMAMNDKIHMSHPQLAVRAAIQFANEFNRYVVQKDPGAKETLSPNLFTYTEVKDSFGNSMLVTIRDLENHKDWIATGNYLSEGKHKFTNQDFLLDLAGRKVLLSQYLDEEYSANREVSEDILNNVVKIIPMKVTTSKAFFREFLGFRHNLASNNANASLYDYATLVLNEYDEAGNIVNEKRLNTHGLFEKVYTTSDKTDIEGNMNLFRKELRTHLLTDKQFTDDGKSLNIEGLDTEAYFVALIDSCIRVATRIPHTSMASASIEMIGHITDSFGIKRINSERNATNDADFDIDQDTAYMPRYKRIRTYNVNGEEIEGRFRLSEIRTKVEEDEEGEFKVNYDPSHASIRSGQKFIREQIRNVYSNPKNAASLLSVVSTEDIKNLVREKKQKYAEFTQRGLALDSYNAIYNRMHLDSVSIFANTAGIYTRLMSLTPEQRTAYLKNNLNDVMLDSANVKKQDLNNIEKLLLSLNRTVFQLIGTFTQVAVDGKKDPDLNYMNVTKITAPIVTAMLMSRVNLVDINNFLTNKRIDYIIKEVERSTSIDMKTLDLAEQISDRLYYLNGILNGDARDEFMNQRVNRAKYFTEKFTENRDTTPMPLTLDEYQELNFLPIDFDADKAIQKENNRKWRAEQYKKWRAITYNEDSLKKYVDTIMTDMEEEYALLSQFQEYVSQAKFYFLLSSVLGFRRGTETKPGEQAIQDENIVWALQSTYDDYIRNGTKDPDFLIKELSIENSSIGSSDISVLQSQETLNTLMGNVFKSLNNLIENGVEGKKYDINVSVVNTGQSGIETAALNAAQSLYKTVMVGFKKFSFKDKDGILKNDHTTTDNVTFNNRFSNTEYIDKKTFKDAKAEIVTETNHAVVFFNGKHSDFTKNTQVQYTNESRKVKTNIDIASFYDKTSGKVNTDAIALEIYNNILKYKTKGYEEAVTIGAEPSIEAKLYITGPTLFDIKKTMKSPLMAANEDWEKIYSNGKISEIAKNIPLINGVIVAYQNFYKKNIGLISPIFTKGWTKMNSEIMKLVHTRGYKYARQYKALLSAYEGLVIDKYLSNSFNTSEQDKIISITSPVTGYKETFNLKDYWDRVAFKFAFSDYIKNYSSSNMENNFFINHLEVDKDGFINLENMKITKNLDSQLQREFDKLSPELKENFFYYSLLRFGFANKKGTMSDYVMNDFTKLSDTYEKIHNIFLDPEGNKEEYDQLIGAPTTGVPSYYTNALMANSDELIRYKSTKGTEEDMRDLFQKVTVLKYDNDENIRSRYTQIQMLENGQYVDVFLNSSGMDVSLPLNGVWSKVESIKADNYEMIKDYRRHGVAEKVFSAGIGYEVDQKYLFMGDVVNITKVTYNTITFEKTDLKIDDVCKIK